MAVVAGCDVGEVAEGAHDTPQYEYCKWRATPQRARYGQKNCATYFCAVPKGFVLLQTLWLLIFASLITISLMATSLGVARNSAAALAAVQAELAAESAVHNVLHDLIKYGPRDGWPRQGETVTVPIDGAEVSVSITNANGLLDVNAADEETLRRIVAAALPGMDAAALVRSIRAARPIQDYASFAAVEGMSADRFDLLFPYLTLFSRKALPSYAEAPGWLRRALNLKQENGSVLTDSNAIAGNVFRIEAVARTRDASSRRLSVELLLTGRLDQPYWIYDWSWHLLDERREGQANVRTPSSR